MASARCGEGVGRTEEEGMDVATQNLSLFGRRKRRVGRKETRSANTTATMCINQARSGKRKASQRWRFATWKAARAGGGGGTAVISECGRGVGGRRRRRKRRWIHVRERMETESRRRRVVGGRGVTHEVRRLTGDSVVFSEGGMTAASRSRRRRCKGLG